MHRPCPLGHMLSWVLWTHNHLKDHRLRMDTPVFQGCMAAHGPLSTQHTTSLQVLSCPPVPMHSRHGMEAYALLAWLHACMVKSGPITRCTMQMSS